MDKLDISVMINSIVAYDWPRLPGSYERFTDRLVMLTSGEIHGQLPQDEFSTTPGPSAIDEPIGGSADIEPLAQARERLLFMCTCCQLDSQMRYHSVALFDEVLALLGDTTATQAGAQAQLLSMACACLLVAIGKFQPGMDAASAWQFVSPAMERAAGDECPQLSQQMILDAKDILQQQLLQDESRPLVTDYIAMLHSSPLLTGLPEFEFVELSTCYSICDILLCSSRFTGGLKSGGKLMAAAVIAAAWMVEVPLAEVPAIAPIRRLEQLSGCPADVVEAQAQVIMQVVLDAAADSDQD